MLTLLAVHFTTVGLAMLIQTHQVADLVAAFAQPIGLAHVVLMAARLAHAFTRNERQLLVRALASRQMLCC